MAAHSYQLLIKEILAAPLAEKSEQEIVHSDVTKYDYPEFADRIGKLATVFADLGLNNGKTIAVMDWDSHRYLECYFAIPMIGSTLHTVNIRLSPEQLLYTINHAEDDAILCHIEFLPLLNQIASRITRPFKLIIFQDQESDYTTDLEVVGEYESLVSNASSLSDFPEFDENTRATLFYTTGTTGNPKGVCYSHRQIVLHTLGGAVKLGTIPNAGLQKTDVYMPITPLFHVHAWGIPYMATMLGIKQVYPGKYDPSTLLSLIKVHGVTFSHCVPTILNMLLSHPDSASVDLSNWKMIIGGSALPQGLAQLALTRGIDVQTGYGLSETCPLLTISDMVASKQDQNNLKIRTAAGKPGPLVQLRVVDEAMKDIPMNSDQTGEIVVRAPWLTNEYVKNPEGTDSLWHGGWLHTGDVGYIDATGTLNITDRLKDVIKSGGEWVSSLELEDLASSVAGVSEVAAIGIPDEKWGERPILLVVTSSDTDEIENQIKSRINEAIDNGKISKWASPDKIEFVEQIPKTSVGKIDKKKLRQEFAK